MKIYLVVKGEYSDWDILGYFDSRYEAEQYCVCHNIDTREEDAYVLEADKLSLTEKQKKTEVEYIHEVVFDYKNGEWIMRDEPTRYSVLFPAYVRPENDIEDKNYGWIAVTVLSKLGEAGRKKVEKIAQDKLYKYLAEKEGI